MFDFLRRVTLILLAGCLPATAVLAHGGAFRGPPDQGPGTGGPGGPRNPGARTGGLGAVGAPTSWMTWWEYNKDPFLRLRDAIHAPEAGPTTSDDQSNPVPASMAPTDTTKRDLVLPALRRLADRESNRDIQTACLVAMAKIGVDHPDFELLPFLRERLERGNQEVRETAALSLGITRRKDALGMLQDLAMDLPAGRRLVKQESVDDRTRSFAIYGIGLVAEGNSDIEVQRSAAEVLMQTLDVDDRDIRVASLSALGLLQVHDSASHKRLGWRVLETLWNFHDKDMGRGNELVQSHATIAIARLLGRGCGAEHQRAKNVLAKLLSPKSKRSNEVQRSAVIALGKLVERVEGNPSEEVYHELLRETFKEAKDELSRYLALMALAEIGGESNRKFLFDAHKKGGKATVKPWAAMALGVLAFHERDRPGGKVDQIVGRVLRQGLNKAKNEDLRSATSIALGLAGYRDASRDMARLFSKYRLKELMLGYIAIGLSLMDATEAVPMLRRSVDDAEHMPLMMMQGSIALGRLGDKHVVDLLEKSLRKGNANVQRLSGIATAFRYVGDKRVVDRLVHLVEDRELTKLARAFVAAALGGVVDANMLPWNASYSVGSNYRSRVGTLSGGSTGILDIL